MLALFHMEWNYEGKKFLSFDKKVRKVNIVQLYNIIYFISFMNWLFPSISMIIRIFFFCYFTLQK